jgi:hypothetical protein
MEKENNNLEDIVRKDIEENALFQVKKAINKFGIEHCEEKIKDLYSAMPKIKEIMLNVYYKIVKGEK